MSYNSLKFAHILIASLWLANLFFCLYQWQIGKMNRVFKLTATVFMPLTLLQLLTGFSLASLKVVSGAWVKISVVSFIVMMTAWFSFILLTKRSSQTMALGVCLIALLNMIFWMANKL